MRKRNWLWFNAFNGSTYAGNIVDCSQTEPQYFKYFNLSLMSSPTVAVPKNYLFLRQNTNSSQPWNHNKHLTLNNPFEFGQIIEEQTELFSGAILQKIGGAIKTKISLGFTSFKIGGKKCYNYEKNWNTFSSRPFSKL